MERELRSLVRVGTSPAARRAKKPQPPFFLASSRRFPAHLTFSTFLLHHLAVCSFLSVFIRGVPGAPFPALPFASACSIPRLNSVAIQEPGARSAQTPAEGGSSALPEPPLSCVSTAAAFPGHLVQRCSLCLSLPCCTPEERGLVRDFASPAGKAEPFLRCWGEGCLCARRQTAFPPWSNSSCSTGAWMSPRLLSAGRGAEISPWKFVAPGLNFSVS